jgi:hypothetical protein
MLNSKSILSEKHITWGSVGLGHCNRRLARHGRSTGTSTGTGTSTSSSRLVSSPEALGGGASVGVHAGQLRAPEYVVRAVKGQLQHGAIAVVFEQLQVVVHVHARGQAGCHEVAAIRGPSMRRGAVAGGGT